MCGSNVTRLRRKKGLSIAVPRNGNLRLHSATELIEIAKGAIG
jgi:hypothetical protein